tara:strand:- start:2504 stop:2818 length:315 start_codon:yes stop_codon:yes gene_type:complete
MSEDKTFVYEMLTYEDKIEVLNTQMKEMEGQHFYLGLVEPQKLTNPEVWQNWNQQLGILENTLVILRESKKEMEEAGDVPMVWDGDKQVEQIFDRAPLSIAEEE